MSVPRLSAPQVGRKGPRPYLPTTEGLGLARRRPAEDSRAATDVTSPSRRGCDRSPRCRNGPRQPALLTGQPGEASTILSWVSPPSADAEHLWTRDRTAGQAWVRMPVVPTGGSWVAEGITDYQRDDLRPQASKGTAVAEDLFSHTVALSPAPPPRSPSRTSP